MKSFFKLLPFIKSQWRLICASLALALPLAILKASPAPLIKHVTDSVLVEKNTRMLILMPLAVVGIALLNLAARFLQGYTIRIANERIMRDCRERLFSHYLGLSSTFFNESSVGKLISRVTNDVFYISHGAVNIAALVRDVLTFLGLFIYAATLNPKLLLLTLVIAPFLVWLGKRSGILMKSYALRMQEANSWVYSSLQEAFSGFRVIKAFALEQASFLRFKKQNDEYVRYALKAARVEEIGGPMVELAAAFAVALIFYIGGLDVIQGKLTAGELLAFFASFGLMINPIRAVNDSNMKLNLAAAAADRVDEALAIQSDIVEKPGAKAMAPFRASIDFVGVGFRYAAELPWVFRGVSFHVRKGETLAIVGASGQGKSTLVNLVPRFYDPSEGKVLIDGIDIRDVELDSLRSQIAVVSQDVFLFNDTIFNNVAAGKANATHDEVMEALRASQALSFVEKMPEGLDTLVGDRGQKLSGGERQRISIARAILRNAPILILDEATSSLDSDSEKAVQAALETLMVGRTTIVIAHRLSTVKHANEILVLANGRVHESGTHEELIKLQGEYARFYALLA